MKTGDKIKSFVQVGLMKKPKWITGEFVSHVDENHVRVNVSGNEVVVTNNNVKLYEPLVYVNGVCKEVEEFVNNNWDDLKRVVTNSVNHFFPDTNLKFDDNEKIIYVDDDYLSIGSNVTEVVSIAKIKEFPCWTVTLYSTIAATRWEPPDVDEINCGDSRTNIGVAKILIDTLWKENSAGYWENLMEQSIEY